MKILHTKAAKASGIGSYKVLLGTQEIAVLHGTRALDMEGKAIIYSRDNGVDRSLLTILGFSPRYSDGVCTSLI